MFFRSAALFGVCFFLGVAVVFGASAGSVPEVEQQAGTTTAVYETIDAIVAERFGATVTQNAIFDAAATNLALTELAPTQTAAFIATVDARFEPAAFGWRPVAVC